MQYLENIELTQDINGKTALHWAQSRLQRLKLRVSKGSFQNVSQIQEELEIIIYWLNQISNNIDFVQEDSSSSFSKINQVQQVKLQLNSVNSLDEIENLLSGLKI